MCCEKIIECFGIYLASFIIYHSFKLKDLRPFKLLHCALVRAILEYGALI